MEIKNIVTVLFLALSTLAQCQVDLNLLNVPLKWFHVKQDTTLPLLQDTFTNINNQITGYENNRTAYSIFNNYLIEVFTTGTNFGTYVTCTDAISGESIWKNSYNLTNDDKIELDFNLNIRSDGNIELSGMRLLNPTVPNIFPFGVPTRKIIDLQTGQLINRTYKYLEDGGCVCNNSNGQMGRTLPIIEDDLYMTVCTYPSIDGQQIQILQKLDNEGSLLDTLSFISNPLMNNDIQSHKLISFNKLDDNRFLIGSGSTSNPQDTNLTITELFFVDNEGQMLLRKDISSLINYSASFLQEYKNEKIFISNLANNNDSAEPDDVFYNLLILDNEGSVLFNIPGYEMLDDEKVGLIRVAEIDNDSYILLGAQENCLKYFSLDATGSIKHLKTVCYSDSNWNLLPMFIELNENGDVINGVRWSHVDDGSYEVTFAINLNEIITTSNTNNSIKRGKASLFPNPGKSSLNIKYQKPISGKILILSLRGHLINEIHLYKEAEKQVDISDLLGGIYLIKTIGQNVLIEQKFIKVN